MQKKLKRIFDFNIAFFLIIILSPLMLSIALVIRLKLGRPILFWQKRPGINTTPFYFVKFRTMNEKKDKKGNLLEDNQRMTNLGSFLRSASLDELPELWNIIKGDMSLVGPRPLLMSYLSQYSDYQNRRHEMLPGITGWAQINGRNSISWEKRFQLDIWYIDNFSLFLDIKILFITLRRVFQRDNINYNEDTPMHRFKGS